MKMKKTKMKCHLCDYEWDTLSERKMITCPNCISKTPREVEEKKKNE